MMMMVESVVSLLALAIAGATSDQYHH